MGRVELGFMNRIIIDDVSINDRSGKKMISASRVSVKMNPFTLLTDNATISSGQLFGADIRINTPKKGADLNCKFLLDLLASKDTTKTKQGLEINSFVVRRGNLKYDVFDQPVRENVLDPAHIEVKNISGHVVFRQDTKGNSEVKLKKLSFKEKSGLDVRKLSFRLKTSDREVNLNDFKLVLPETSINVADTKVMFRKQDGKVIDATISFDGGINSSEIVLSDFASIVPALRSFNTPLILYTSVSGTSTSLRVHDFTLYSEDKKINIQADGSMSNFSNPSWYANINRLILNAGTVNFLKTNFGEKNVEELEVLARLGDIHFKGRAGGAAQHISLNGNLISGAGSASLALGKKGDNFIGAINTGSLDLGKITALDDLGNMAARLEFRGKINEGSDIPDIEARGTISEINYKKHRYKDITIDGTYRQHKFDGMLSIDDPDAYIKLQGIISYFGKNPTANFNAVVEHFNPSALGLTEQWKDAVFDMNINADFDGKDANSASGMFAIKDFTMKTPEDTLAVDEMNVAGGMRDDMRYLSLRSDFIDADVEGMYNYTTLAKSITDAVAKRLPTIMDYKPEEEPADNKFAMRLKLKDSKWIRMFFGVPVDISSPIMIGADVCDRENRLNFNCSLPSFKYNKSEYGDGKIRINSNGDSLKLVCDLVKTMGNGHKMDLALSAAIAEDKLMSRMTWDNNREGEFSGCINLITDFIKNKEGVNETRVNFYPSEMTIGGVKWYVRPATVTMGHKEINIDNFTAENDSQHLIISGKATDNESDSIVVNMRDMEVAYILDLVNFHSVKFSGRASGKAAISSVFGKPSADADLIVDDFRFQEGRMGTLHAGVRWNNVEEQVEIDAVADDMPTGKTLIKGYVSPKNNYLWLNIGARKMRAEFLEGFCGSFMNNVTALIEGDAVVGGPLDRINLMGDLYLTGNLGIKSVGTNYMLDHVDVHCEPDVIQIRNGKMSDDTGGSGMLNGELRHRSFTRLRYDLGIEAEGLPMYNTTGDRGDTFYGTVYIDGKCRIHGNSDDVRIDVDARPTKNSFMIYDASAPDAINSRNFITWKTSADSTEIRDREEIYNSTDIRMNLNIDATSALELKVLLDKESGDNLSLRGEGALNATYYNKGPFNMYGTYNIREGIYRLTIQQILEKKFLIQNGSRIVFAGDPYDAALNLNATHTVNGVSLSDLKIGKSFSNNTIRVNCIMGIHGTPAQPRVDFDIDMPTVDGEIQQMIRSMITTEEDMNRQVVYILGIGRFYVPEDSNMESDTGPSQTSLAMQSLLSGTISSQINSFIGRIVNSNTWNIGANISTGDEGWNNAEYEGILTGRLLNNRLLINGQFGYRDNANATTGFIGDFDIRYLLFPNGNFAVRLYNQSNDRYFTKSSLTTQGVGLIIKKDFFNLYDLFGINRKKKEKEEKPVTKTIIPAENKETK